VGRAASIELPQISWNRNSRRPFLRSTVQVPSLHRLLQPRRHAGCSSTKPRRFVISSATQRNPRWNFSFVSREEKRRHFP
jgi:hypothetical protein